MSIKNTLGLSLLFIGLVVLIVGCSRGDSTEITKEINGKEVVLKNSDAENLNWRIFYGSVVSVLGIGILAFPGQKTIDAGKFD